MVLIVLIVVVAACVAAGVLTGILVLSYIALGLSLLGAAFFGVLAWREFRRDATGMQESTAAVPQSEAEELTAASPQPKDSTTQQESGWSETEEPAATVEEAPTAAAAPPSSAAVPDNDSASTNGTGQKNTSPAEFAAEPRATVIVEAARGSDSVYVIPGRRRFHQAACPILEQYEHEELTLDDARDEGFSACTSCAVT